MKLEDTHARVAELEHQLDLSLTQWQTTFDAITDWVCIIDLNFRILRSNRSCADILGLDPRNVVGRTCYEMVHGTMAHIAGCPIPKMIETGKRGESELHLPDGRWIMVTADPLFDDRGFITGAVHMVRDITKRKLIETALQENQERLRLAAEAASLGLWDWRLDLNRLFPNEIFMEISGLSLDDANFFTAEKWLSRVHPEERGAVKRALEEHLNGTSPKAFIECRIKHPEKGWIWVSGLGQVIERNRRGEAIRMVGVHRDVTEQVLASREKENLINKLERALADVKTLSGMLPICSQCKKIRDDQGYWSNIESYIQQHSLAQFSHSICPDCAKKYYPDLKIY
ncbi:PAS domain-containing protein [Desulfatibacillum aliphaticivorans]|uniref:PAS domain-containing protein n=1 Tax=Desulfatibacillum aliphaticivorans TaxID=218208 RepID=UPI000400075E|nr:PAS domain-containing protein [Desulfatibacillum aliphaticivorans]